MSLIFDGGKAGEGGGGKPIQYETMPSPIIGDIIQYVGETGANYTQGYFYQGVGGGTGSATIAQTSGTGITNLDVNVEIFKNYWETTFMIEPLTTGDYVFTYNLGNEQWECEAQTADMVDFGISFTEPQSSIEVSVSPAEGESIVWAYVEDQARWDSAVSESGQYIFTYDSQLGDFTLDGTTSADLYDTYGINYESGYAVPPETSVEQTVGSGLTIDVDAYAFTSMAGDSAGDYTFTFDSNGDWLLSEWGDEQVDLSQWGITIDGTETENDQFVVSLAPPTYGPTDGDQIIVDFTTGLNDGDEITVSYTEASATWQQINVQPTPEIATQETVGGNVELSADEGVIVIATPDGTEDKQVANVEYVNNIVGDIADILSEV